MREVKPKDVLWEAQLLGISAVEYAKKLNEQIDQQKDRQVLSEDEALKAEAKRIYEGLKAENPSSQITIESVRKMLINEKNEKAKQAIKAGKINFLVSERMLAGAGQSCLAPKRKIEE